MRVLMIGTGYVGLVTGVALAVKNHTVHCVDVDETKIRKLQNYQCTIYEEDLQEHFEAARGRISFGMDMEAALKDRPDVIMIAVGTPEKADGSADLSFVYDAVDQVIAGLVRSCVVVIKSTVPIGTNLRLQSRFDKKLAQGLHVHVVSNPEFMSQGTAMRDMLHGDRIVVGTSSDDALSTMANLYKDLDQPIFYTDTQSAEMIKYAANNFLALKISYINEIANLCEALGANAEDVAHGIGMDTRIGSQFLRAGIGYGGSCFPKDTKALHWLGCYHERELKTVKAAIEVNENQKLMLLKKSRRYYESLEGLTVAVLGLSFKPGTDDVREAPSLANFPLMLDEGAYIKAWDPRAADYFKRRYPDVQFFDTPQETLQDADICFIFTEWPEVRALTGENFLAMHTPIILDGRNCYPIERMAEFPLLYYSVGRKVAGCLQVAKFK